MKAVVLMLGLSLLVGLRRTAAQEIELPPAPVPVRPLAPPRPAPEPLPSLPELGLPAGGAGQEPVPPPLSIRPQPTAAAAPAPPREVVAPPARPPAFRVLVPLQGQDTTSLRPATPPPLPTVHADVRPVAVMQTPSLTLEKRGPASVRAGQPFAYELVVRNVGTVPAQQVRLEDELPPSTRVLGAQPPAISQGDRLVWTVETLPPGAEQRFRVEVVPSAGGEWIGKATVMMAVSRTLHVEVAGAPASPLALGVTGPAGVLLGHPVTFDVRLTNTGSVPLVKLMLRAPLPPGLDHLQGSDIEAPLETLAPGETKALKLDAIAAHPGRQVIEITVLAGGQPQTVARGEVVVVEEPVLAMRLVGPAEGWTGRASEYRLEVTNRTGVVARNVTVTDVLPEGLAFVGSGAAFHDPATRTVRWALGNLEPGQTRAVPLGLVSRFAGRVLNQATARNAQGHEARLHSILSFRVPEAPTAPGLTGRR